MHAIMRHRLPGGIPCLAATDIDLAGNDTDYSELVSRVPGHRDGRREFRPRPSSM